MNNLLDPAMSINILAGLALLNWSLARRFRVSHWPTLAMLPLFYAIGLVLHLPSSPWFIPSDGEFYLAWTDSIAIALLGGEPEIVRTIWPGKGVWSAGLAILQLGVGTPIFSAIALASGLSATSIVAIQKAAYNLTGRTADFPSVLLFSSCVGYLIFGPSTLRESLFWLGVAMGVLATTEVGSGNLRRTFAHLAISAVVLVGVRPDFGLALALCFLTLNLTIAAHSARKDRSSSRWWFSGGIATVILFSYPSFQFMIEGRPVNNIPLVTSRLAGDSVTSGFKTAVSNGRVTDSELSIIADSFLRLPNILFGPLPYEFESSPIFVLATLSTIQFWIVIGFSAYYGIQARSNLAPLIGLSLIAVISVGIFALILGNYGILIRFRVVTILLLAPLALGGWQVFVNQIRCNLSGARNH